MSPIRAGEQQRYPKDWPQIRARILARAGGRCEFSCADGSRCDAPDLTMVYRSNKNPERWGLGDVDFCGDCYQVRVVLTVAHLNHQPEDCSDENLKSGCQLHHLRHDAKHHAGNAARTRRAKKGNGELFGAGA
jgi:hypothetical protein